MKSMQSIMKGTAYNSIRSNSTQLDMMSPHMFSLPKVVNIHCYTGHKYKNQNKTSNY
jgi:hypothetical protein